MALTQTKDAWTSAPDGASTPLMSQYLAIKASQPDCLLFFRLGDFYELFFEDAIAAARALDITLTCRGQIEGRDVPMCGVPVHAYESYLAKLIRQGFRVAVCEQTEAPAEAKKRGGKAIVRREIVRIVTPGTVTEDALLHAHEANVLACVAAVGGALGVAWMDLTDGQPRVEKTEKTGLEATLARLNAAEILVPQKMTETLDFSEPLATFKDKLTPQPDARFDSENGRRLLTQTYGVDDLAAFGDFSRAEIAALGALIDYVALTQKTAPTHLRPPRQQEADGSLSLDPATRRNLELTRTLAGERRGSLLDAIDRTVTGAGARLLAARLAQPLRDVGRITKRLDAVGFFVDRKDVREAVRRDFSQTPDLERALARLALLRGGPRDLAAIRDALGKAEGVRGKLLALGDLPEELAAAVQDLDPQARLIDELRRALGPELPLLARDGGFVARGYDVALDEARTLRDDARRLIAGLQQKYAAETGISGLKIRHNNLIGYHIEVSPAHADKLLARKETFIHRQTLVSGVRFSTVELGEWEQKIAQAGERALALELRIFTALSAAVTNQMTALRRTAEALARLDVAAALAELAVTMRYGRPVVDESLALTITDGRHPVVEQALAAKTGTGSFVPNACDLGAEQNLWLLTGPNMAGKSTFLRQNALIVILAQMGSFVPAAHAHIGLVDRLFSRVGAADDLARGQSTFMVEMVETAAILNQATARSLVILDEIGRGTATYDGLSIAWATLEHLHNVNAGRTLFATHYHELTSLARTLPRLFCATMKIREWEKEIVFLHEVAPGTADRSYGLHVAQMAGLPGPVIARAQEVLDRLEAEKTKTAPLEDLPLFRTALPEKQEKKTSPVLEALAALDPDLLSPRQALDMLYELKKKTAP